jgi:hypothetical protein
MAQLNPSQIATYAGKNYLINGGFQVWQRGSSFTSLSGYAADRWEALGSTNDYSQQTFDPDYLPNLGGEPATYYLRMDADGGGAIGISQKIEDVRPLAGKTVTLSFWAQSDESATLESSRIRQYFGSGGSASSYVDTFITVPQLSSTWQKYSVTFTIPSISGKTIDGTDHYTQLQLRGSAATCKVRLAQVQLEAGPSATDFQHRPYAEELALCQRYYFRIQSAQYGHLLPGYVDSSTEVRCSIVFPTPMAGTPAAFFGSLRFDGHVTSGAIVSAVSLPYSSNMCARVSVTVDAATAGDPGFLKSNSSTNGFLAFDAEL